MVHHLDGSSDRWIAGSANLRFVPRSVPGPGETAEIIEASRHELPCRRLIGNGDPVGSGRNAGGKIGLVDKK